jgi:hypothetical protein
MDGMGDVRIDRWYIVRKPAPRPMKPVRRMIGAMPPFPTYDGANLSQVSIRAGPAAATVAPTT